MDGSRCDALVPRAPGPMIGRRAFVAGLGAAFGAMTACGDPRSAARDSAHPPAPPDPNARTPSRPPAVTGLQLYTVRRAMERDFDGTLARVREIGYDEVEFAGWFGRRPAAVRASLRRLGLAAPAAHITLEAIDREWDETLEAAAAIGHRYLILPWVDAERRRTLDDWRRVAELLGRAGAASARAGIRLGYHNHDVEFPPVDGTIPLELLLDETDPSAVAFELDFYWMVKAGHDPLGWLERYPGRFELTHLKDTGGPPDHAMAEVGAGTLNWPRLVAAANAAGVRHHFVEHDHPADEFVSIRASNDYLRSITVPPAVR